MKIRSGFVSNSSTTSFCVFGVELPFDSYEDLMRMLRFTEEKIRAITNGRNESEDIGDETKKKYCLDSVWDYESETCYLGINLHNQTSEQLIDSLRIVDHQLRQLFPYDVPQVFIVDVVG